jgi:uncharacterized protein (DUF488 family)
MWLMSKSVSAEIFTIGHSNHSRERFIQLLRDREIQVLVDVRSHPHSRFVPWADQSSLAGSVQAVGVKYLFLGDRLGGRPSGSQFYDSDGHALYWKIARSESFRTGIKRLCTGAKRYRIAIMCSEEDPTFCHRRLLVAKVLLEDGVVVSHIRGDGSCESESEPLDLSADALFPDEESLWRSSLSVSHARLRKTSSAA